MQKLTLLKPTFKYSNWLNIGIIGFFLVAIAMIAMIPMLLHGYPIAHSTQFNLSWAFQYQRQFMNGQLYPRWLEFSNFGFGNATFVFYPPMLVIATLPFSLLGMDLPTSIISSMIFAAFVLAWGIYLYAVLYFPSWLALIISGLAVASPYFLIDIYQRGANAEVWAIAFIPWVLLSTHKLINQIDLPPIQRTHAISLAIAWGLLGLSHLPTLLISFLAWLPIPLWLLKDLIKSSSCKIYAIEVGRCYLSASLGFIGISFFLMPVIFDQKLVQIESINFSPEYLPQNRLLIDGLLSLFPKLATHWFETSSGLIPYFGILCTVVVIRAIACIFWQSIAPETFVWMMISAIAIFMTTDLSSWLYQLLPTLQRIQFSWRWYGLTVTTIPMLLGSLCWQILLLDNIKIIKILKIIKIITACLIIGLITTSYIYTDKIVFQQTRFDPAIITKFSQLAAQKSFPKEPNPETQGTPILWWHWTFSDGLAIVDVPEYRAKGVTLPMPPRQLYPLAAWQSDHSTDHIKIKRWEYGLREIVVENQSSNQLSLALRMFYYPAWQVWIDGKKNSLQATPQGQAQIEIANGQQYGQHSILIKYIGTRSEQLGAVLSWFSIIFASYIFWHIKTSNPVESSDDPKPHSSIIGLR